MHPCYELCYRCMFMLQQTPPTHFLVLCLVCHDNSTFFLHSFSTKKRNETSAAVYPPPHTPACMHVLA